MQGQLGMLSGGLPLASLGSFGKLSALPSLGTLSSLGRSNGTTEAPRFGAPRMPEGAAVLHTFYVTHAAHILCLSPINHELHILSCYRCGILPPWDSQPLLERVLGSPR